MIAVVAVHLKVISRGGMGCPTKWAGKNVLQLINVRKRAFINGCTTLLANISHNKFGYDALFKIQLDVTNLNRSSNNRQTFGTIGHTK